MSYRVRFAPRAADDMQRLFDFLVGDDLPAAERARAAISQAISLLQSFPALAGMNRNMPHPLKNPAFIQAARETLTNRLP